MTFVWHPDDPVLRELRVTLTQVAFEAFGLQALPRVRMPLLEGERMVLLKASSPMPGGVLGADLNSIGQFVDEAPAACFDASLTAFASERGGQSRVDVRLVNVRIRAGAPTDQKHPS